jgi:hypothetical protein
MWPGSHFYAVAAAYVAAHLITIPNSSGHRVSLTPAVAGAAALLTNSPVVVLGAAGVALPIGWLAVRFRWGRRATDDLYAADAVGLVLFTGAFLGGRLALPGAEPSHPVVLAMFVGACALWFAIAVAIRARGSRLERLASGKLVLLRSLEDWPAYAALFSSAALFAVTEDAMGLWSIPLAGLPYLFSHLSLSRVQDTRRAYDQTIRALGAIPEASGHVADGHAARSGELAVAVGAELGLGSGTLRRLEYAALLHDIGRVVLGNPNVSLGDYSFADVSGWSAAIIAEAPYLESVATIVASQHQPYRKPGEERDPEIPVGSQIVRIVARYDSALDEEKSPLEAMELLHSGVAYDYDPQVVGALRRVLEQRGVIAA